MANRSGDCASHLAVPLRRCAHCVHCPLLWLLPRLAVRNARLWLRLDGQRPLPAATAATTGHRGAPSFAAHPASDDRTASPPPVRSSEPPPPPSVCACGSAHSSGGSGRADRRLSALPRASDPNAHSGIGPPVRVARRLQPAVAVLRAAGAKSDQLQISRAATAQSASARTLWLLPSLRMRRPASLRESGSVNGMAARVWPSPCRLLAVDCPRCGAQRCDQ